MRGRPHWKWKVILKPFCTNGCKDSKEKDFLYFFWQSGCLLGLLQCLASMKPIKLTYLFCTKHCAEHCIFKGNKATGCNYISKYFPPKRCKKQKAKYTFHYNIPPK